MWIPLFYLRRAALVALLALNLSLPILVSVRDVVAGQRVARRVCRVVLPSVCRAGGMQRAPMLSLVTGDPEPAPACTLCSTSRPLPLLALLVQAGAAVVLALAWVLSLLFFEPIKPQFKWVLYSELLFVGLETMFMIAMGFILSAAGSLNTELLPSGVPNGAGMCMSFSAHSDGTHPHHVWNVWGSCRFCFLFFSITCLVLCCVCADRSCS